MPLLLILLAFSYFDHLLVPDLRGDYALTLFADYASRMVVLAGLCASPFARRAIAASFRRTAVWRTLAWAAATLVLWIALDHFVRLPLYDLVPALVIFHWPRPDSFWLYAFDLTFGLALVALSEELLTRVYFRAVVEPRLGDGWAMIGLSALAFAGLHWGQGVGAVVSTFLVGLFFMWLYRRTDSVLPLLAGHYLTNFYAFGLRPFLPF